MQGVRVLREGEKRGGRTEGREQGVGKERRVREKKGNARRELQMRSTSKYLPKMFI